MKTNKPALVGALCLLLAGCLDPEPTPSESLAAAADDTALEHAQKHLDPKYVCPMHPQIVRDEAGSCPICGMALVPKMIDSGAGKRPTVEISNAIINSMGVRTQPAANTTLWKYIETVGRIDYDETRLAIVPMGFCFPGLDEKGGDLPPRPECAPLWRERVLAELGNVELLLLVGQYAQRWHLADKASRRATLTETVRDWERILAQSARPRLLPLPHPSWRNNAWLRANPWFETELLPALRAEVARLTA